MAVPAARAKAQLRMLLHSGIDLMTQMPITSELIHAVVPSFSLSCIRVNEHCAPRAHYSEFFDDWSHQFFAAAGDQISANTSDPAAFGNLLRNKRRPYGNLVDGSPEFLQGDTYQYLFSRNGIHHVLDVAVRDANGPLGIVGIFREKGTRAFAQHDVAVVGELYESFVHAFQITEKHTDFDEAESAMLVTSAEGVVEWATPSLRRWLEDATGGPERARLMTEGTLPEACRELARRLTRGELPTLTLAVPGGRLRLRGYGMTPFSPGILQSRVAIHLQVEMHRTLRVFRALQRENLPPTLMRLALCHAAADSTSAIREQLGVSAATLKSYNKELYARLEVTSSTELAQYVRSLANEVDLDLTRHLPPAQRTGYPPTAVGGSLARGLFQCRA